MAVEISWNEKVFGGGKDGEGKGVGSSVRQQRANRGCINIKE